MRNTRHLSTLLLIIQPLFLNAVSIPATGFIIRSLGAQAYGQWAIATSVVGITSVLSSLGLRPIFLRAISQQPASASDELADQLGLRSLLAVGSVISALLLCLCLRYPIVVLECVAITAVGLILSVLAGTLVDVLHGYQRFRTYTAINFASGLVVTIITVLSVWKGHGPVTLSLAYLSGPFTSLLLCSCAVHLGCCRVRVRWNFMRFSLLLSESRTLGAHQVLVTLRERAEQLLVPKLASIAAFGYFSVGSMLADRLMVAPEGLIDAYFPAISSAARISKQKATEQVAELIRTSLVVCLPIAVLITFLAQPIGQLVFPKSPAVCIFIMRVTIWYVPFMGLALALSLSLQAAGKHVESAQAGVRATICCLIVSLLLVSRFGVYGACFSMLFRPVAAALLVFPSFRREFPTVGPLVPFWRIVFCASGMAASLWVSTWLSMPILYSLTSGFVLSLGTYIGILLLLRIICPSQYLTLLGRKSACVQTRIINCRRA